MSNATEADFHHIPTLSTMLEGERSLPNASPTRFPIVENLLKALADSANEDVYGKAILPFAKDSSFTTQLIDEMDKLKNVLRKEASPVSNIEKTLFDRLEQMENSLQQLVNHIDKLETTIAAGRDESVIDKSKQ